MFKSYEKTEKTLSDTSQKRKQRPKVKEKVEESKKAKKSDEHKKLLVSSKEEFKVNVWPRVKSERRLDTLARLLEGPNVCAAVTIIEDKLYVTTNKGHSNFSAVKSIENLGSGPRYCCNFLTHLSKLKLECNSILKLINFKENLARETAKIESKQRFFFVEPSHLELINNELLNEGIGLLQFNLIGKLKNDMRIGVADKTALVNFVERFSSKIIKALLYFGEKHCSSLIKLNPNEFIVHLYPNFYDCATHSMTKSAKRLADICQLELLLKLYPKLEREVRDYRNLIIAFQRGLFDTVKSYQFLLIGNKNEHAEMRMLAFLLNGNTDNRLYEIKWGDKKDEIDCLIWNEKLFVGISKLCCSDCFTTYLKFNEMAQLKTPEFEEDVKALALEVSNAEKSSDILLDTKTLEEKVRKQQEQEDNSFGEAVTLGIGGFNLFMAYTHFFKRGRIF